MVCKEEFGELRGEDETLLVGVRSERFWRVVRACDSEVGLGSSSKNRRQGGASVLVARPGSGEVLVR